jgi:hypothetical protein
LQVFQPFIHGHLDTEHDIQHVGFHVGSEHEESTSELGHASEHALTGVPHASHTVSVASGIKKDADLNLLINTIGLALIFLCFVAALKSISVLFSQLKFNPYQSLKRRLPATRAPPQF